jgi:iron complex transport system substrate-binding protein
MSSSYIGFLDVLGCDSVATAVSGLAYVSDPEVRAQAVDVGYDAALDYETILKVKPDLLLTYAVSAAEPPYLAKLRELGIRTAIIHEHLESHPLARAEYIKLFGLLTGRAALADSLFADIRDRYLSLVSETTTPAKVLVNIPYADQWYIPGGDNYMTRLIRDAGGRVLGAVPGRFESSVISVEKAFEYAQEADFWLNPGWCTTKDQLRSEHPLFADFPVIDKPVWNNTKQSTPGGGNAFWETGPARPDVILQDLRAIFDGTEVPMQYFFPLE